MDSHGRLSVTRDAVRFELDDLIIFQAARGPFTDAQIRDALAVALHRVLAHMAAREDSGGYASRLASFPEPVHLTGPEPVLPSAPESPEPGAKV